jgi:hypothetical protein
MPFVSRHEVHKGEADDVRQGVREKELKRGFRAMHRISGLLVLGAKTI